MYFWSILTWLFFVSLLIVSRVGLEHVRAIKGLPEELGRPLINSLRLIYGVAWGGLVIVTLLGILARPQAPRGMQKIPKATPIPKALP